MHHQFLALAVACGLILPVTVISSSAQSIATTAEQPAQPEASSVLAGSYVVDPAHTQVTWEVNHMGISMLGGMFGVSGGSLTLDPENLSATQLAVDVDIGDIAVTFPAFSEHLLSGDFFEVEEHPEARFISSSVEVDDGATTGTLVGDLTIKGVTQSVSMDVEFVGAGINPMDEKLHVGFSGRAMILRSDFDLGAYAPGVSDEVVLRINAAFVAE